MATDTRALLMRMLVERAGLPAEATGPEMLAHLGDGDPRLRLLMEMMSRRAEAEAEDEADETEIYSAAEPEVLPPAAPDAGWDDGSDEEQAAVMQQMAVELEHLRARSDALAAALGACYLCWGADAACGHCFGKGRPGAARPDERLFRQLVLPAVMRRGRQRGATGAPPNNPTAR